MDVTTRAIHITARQDGKPLGFGIFEYSRRYYDWQT